MGYIYMSQHETQRAMECCEQAPGNDREIGDMMGVTLDSFNMANLLAQQGRFSEALSCAEESARVLEKVGHIEKARQACRLVAEIRAALR
jgi:tetratricopeptide (TPR) repeat protein